MDGLMDEFDGKRLGHVSPRSDELSRNRVFFMAAGCET
jgi:hypothetical protein